MMERTTDCLGVAMKRLKRLLVPRQKFEEEEEEEEEQRREEEAERKVHILEKLQKKVLTVPEEKTSREDAEKHLKLSVPPSASSPSYGVSEGNQHLHEKKGRGKEAWGFAKKFQAGRCEEFYNSQSVAPHNIGEFMCYRRRNPRPGFNIEVRQQGICIRLKNITTEDKHLGGSELHLQVNDTKTCMYTFDRSFKLKAGRCVTMWAAGYGPNRSNTELEWKDLKPWKTGDRLWFTIDSFWL